MSDNYLQHHGVLGQKWGVRRYQNVDGSLTDEGRKRLNRIENGKSLSYNIGLNRLKNRKDRIADQKIADAASASSSKRSSTADSDAYLKATENLINDKIQTSLVGEKTIANRTIASVGALAASGSSLVLAAAADSAIPLVGIPASTIALGAYYYNSKF